MAQSFLVFDFGNNEDLAQQARHKVDGWKQGFRLDKKLLLKFDRAEAGETAQGEATDPEKKPEAKAAKKPGATEKSAKGPKEGDKEISEEKGAKESIRLIIRLDFSDHERLSHQRWLERIPLEPPFKDTQPKVIRHNDAEFAGTAERFDSLP